MKYVFLSLLFFAALHFTLNAFECFYVPKLTRKEPEPSRQARGQCGILATEDNFILHKKHFENLDFRYGDLVYINLSSVPTGGVPIDDIKVFYVLRSGKIMRTHFYDNGADYFVDGLARTIAERKFGYIDKKLTVVIEPQYDFAFPFDNGIAVVCNGCGVKPKDNLKTVEGGTWGLIDTAGKVLLPLQFSANDDLPQIYGKLLQKNR